MNLPRWLINGAGTAAACLSLALGSPSTKPTPRMVVARELGQSPLHFERNDGQAAAGVQFVSRGPGYSLLLSGDGATLRVSKREDGSQQGVAKLRAPRLRVTTPLRMSLVGANSQARATGIDSLPSKVNYLIGNDPKHWLREVPNFTKVKFAGVYPGIDLLYYGNPQRLEYDYLAAPGADPTRIRLSFDGAKTVRLEPGTGDLLITTATGSEVRHGRPSIYQMSRGKRLRVAGGFRLLGANLVAFDIGPYDTRRALIIDPTVDFTTFLAGSSMDFATGVAVDAAGNSYVAGYTSSSDFPLVGTAPQPVQRSCASAATFSAPNVAGAPSVPFNAHSAHILSNSPAAVALVESAAATSCSVVAFVTKLSPSGQILFSTYIGGNQSTFAWAIAADSEGVFITGITNSTNFIGNSELAFGSSNAYVAKLDPNGEVYHWVTGFGGEGLSVGNAIALDAQHAAYVTGFTQSVDFPTSEYLPVPRKSWQPVFGGVEDAFVVKVDPFGELNEGYSTYIGGPGDDIGTAIAVDSTGHAYVTGATTSENFPTIGPNFSGSPAGGGATAFVVKLQPDGSGAVYSTYLGGEADASDNPPFDGGSGIAVNSSGQAYVTGTTCSTNFPTTGGALQRSQPFPCSSLSPIDRLVNNSGFVTVMSSSGRVLYSTYLGGNNFTNPCCVALNQRGELYVGGVTASTTFLNANVGFVPNPYEGFLTKVSPTLSAVAFTQFLGAQITGVAVEPPPAGILGRLDAQILTTGFRYRPGTDVNNDDNTDVFAVKLTDPLTVVSVPLTSLSH